MAQQLCSASMAPAASAFQSKPGLSPWTRAESAPCSEAQSDPAFPWCSAPAQSPASGPVFRADLTAAYAQLFNGLCDEPAHASRPAEQVSPGEQTPAADACQAEEPAALEPVCEPGVGEPEAAGPEALGPRDPLQMAQELAPSALNANKFTSDLVRLPKAVREAGEQGLKRNGLGARLWDKGRRAGAAGEKFLERHLSSKGGRFVEQTKNALGYLARDGKTIWKHLAGTAGGKLAAKVGGKLVPGVNAVTAVGAAGFDIKKALAATDERNYVGATIEGLHALTDAAGAVPGLGTAVSLAGDAAAIGAHWVTGR